MSHNDGNSNSTVRGDMGLASLKERRDGSELVKSGGLKSLWIMRCLCIRLLLYIVAS